MNAGRRKAEDRKAIDELVEWCKPLSLEVVDNGCSLYLKALGKSIADAWYRRPWLEENGRSVAAAARSLVRQISEGMLYSVMAEKEYYVEGGGTVYEAREYTFKVPPCSSPSELAIKLAVAGWRPPADLGDRWLEPPRYNLKLEEK